MFIEQKQQEPLKEEQNPMKFMKQIESLEATQNNPFEHTQNQPTLNVKNEQSEDFIR